MAELSWQPIQSAQAAFPYQVYASTRLEEMALLDWSAEQKETFLRMQFDLREKQYQAAHPDAVTGMILHDGSPAGMMITVQKADEILLVDIALLPEFRGHGIGTEILQELQSNNKKIILHVLKQNPAVRLYTRLGFVSIDEDSMYLTMEWTPQ